MTSVLQDWVMNLGLRHQGAVVSAVRGCDVSPKDDASKHLTRCLRAELLVCHCGDPKLSISFIEWVDDDELQRRMIAFLKDCDHYPLHYFTHLMHTVEIIGYKKPKDRWLWFYNKLCKVLHVHPETEEELDARLCADEKTFGQMAKVT